MLQIPSAVAEPSPPTPREAGCWGQFVEWELFVLCKQGSARIRKIAMNVMSHEFIESQLGKYV